MWPFPGLAQSFHRRLGARVPVPLVADLDPVVLADRARAGAPEISRASLLRQPARVVAHRAPPAGAADFVRLRNLRPPHIASRTAPVTPVPSVPVVRWIAARDLTLQAFDHPAALRRIFPEAPGDFSSPDTHAGMLLRALSAPNLAAAQVAMAEAERLAAVSPRTPLQIQVQARVADAGWVSEAQPRLWGEEPGADALRLRSLREHEPGAAPDLGWGRFLSWAGRRLPAALPRSVPALAVPAAFTAIACDRGAKDALLALLAHHRTPWTHPRLGPVARSLALRCAVEKTFGPSMVAPLLPQGRRAGPTSDRALRYLPGVLAWELSRHDEQPAGFVHLSAALVSADVRCRFRSGLAQQWMVLDRKPAAGTEGPDHVALAAVVSDMRQRGAAFTHAPGAWEDLGGGPDSVAVVAALERELGQPGRGPEIFLDTRLAVAAIWALLGYGPSAHARVAGARVPPALMDARSSLLRVLARPSAGQPWDVPGLPAGPDARRVLERLRSTPEPSLALGSPFWMEHDRARSTTRLLREGKRTLVSAVRSVLDRTDMRADLSPLWVMRGTPDDTASVKGLAQWLAFHAAVRPSERDWLRLLDRWCREELEMQT